MSGNRMLLRKLFITALFSLGLLTPGLKAIVQDAFAADKFTTAEQAPSFLPVEQAYQSLLEWRDGRLHISWTIADGYYLYEQRFEFAIIEDGEQRPLDIALPAGKVKDDPYFGRTPVYYYNLNHSIDWPASSEPKTLVLTAQGCADAGLCYPPYTQYARIDTQIDVCTGIRRRPDSKPDALRLSGIEFKSTGFYPSKRTQRRPRQPVCARRHTQLRRGRSPADSAARGWCSPGLGLSITNPMVCGGTCSAVFCACRRHARLA